MTNHVHLLITPVEHYSLSEVMQSLGRRYVRYINATYRRSGTLWEGRYKASLIDSEVYLLTCMRYIEPNPVRARMVAHPGEYRWSSYDANAQGREDTLITPHPVYQALGAEPAARARAYRALFSGHLDQDELHAIRGMLNQELVLGREDFKDKIEAMTNRRAREGLAGRPPRVREAAERYVA